jgi:hypothetical protein
MIAVFFHQIPAWALYRRFSRQVIDFKPDIGEVCLLKAAMPEVCPPGFMGIF